MLWPIRNQACVIFMNKLFRTLILLNNLHIQLTCKNIVLNLPFPTSNSQMLSLTTIPCREACLAFFFRDKKEEYLILVLSLLNTSLHTCSFKSYIKIAYAHFPTHKLTSKFFPSWMNPSQSSMYLSSYSTAWRCLISHF